RLQPWPYVAQLSTPENDRTGKELPEYGPYPDETRFTIDWSKTEWLHASWDSQPSQEDLRLTPDETEWTEKRFYYTVTDPKFEFAVPILQSDNNSGKVYFDDIRIEEIGPAGRRLVADIDIEDPSGWYLWEGDAAGRPLPGTGVVARSADAHRGDFSITLSGTSGYANLGTDGSRAFLVTLGSTYEVTSWIKGENSAPDAMSLVRIDFYGYDGKLFGFDREMLDSLFDDFGAWGVAQGVPLNVNSFGTNRATFDRGLGGLAWVNDMIDVMRERGLHFTYYSYHQPDFGLYTNRPGLPDPETYNQALADRLYAKLHGE
ncbi:MAG TPA: hypothetical protein VGK73_28410, partial [Polyangiaceae bacterium]